MGRCSCPHWAMEVDDNALNHEAVLNFLSGFMEPRLTALSRFYQQLQPKPRLNDLEALSGFTQMLTLISVWTLTFVQTNVLLSPVPFGRWESVGSRSSASMSCCSPILCRWKRQVLRPSLPWPCASTLLFPVAYCDLLKSELWRLKDKKQISCLHFL